MVRMPKIVGEIWLNSPALTADDLKNKVVLIDFWTYSCVNCRRTLPYLADLWRKYKDEGLLIVGIHTPEFEFEKSKENVESACREAGVTWPVVLDNDYINWNNFANRYWPAKYLADREGKIVYTHFGEGNYEETENAIRALLGKASGKEMPKIEIQEHSHGNVCFVPTPELYVGYKRGYLSNGAYVENTVAEYKAPQMKEDTIGLEGKFLAKPEYAESQDAKSTLILKFRATEVNLVLHPVGDKARVKVLLDGKEVPKEYWGHDLDESEAEIKEPTMYNLIKTGELLEGVLEIKPVEGNFRAYAFTFSGCNY